jgi:hypothetical protein
LQNSSATNLSKLGYVKYAYVECSSDSWFIITVRIEKDDQCFSVFTHTKLMVQIPVRTIDGTHRTKDSSGYARKGGLGSQSSTIVTESEFRNVMLTACVRDMVTNTKTSSNEELMLGQSTGKIIS